MDSKTDAPREKRVPPQIRWCGDLRTVIDGGPFDAASDDEPAEAPPPLDPPKTNAA